jgi:hypothetical protein
MSYYANSLK